MRSFLNNFLLLLAAVLLQTTVAPFMAIKKIEPDIILMVVVAYAFLDGSAQGSLVGFAGGLLQDLAVGPVLGLNALAKTVVGYVAGLLEDSILFESIFLPVIAVFIATVFHNIVFGAAAMVFDRGPLLMSLLVNLAPAAAYNSALAVILFPVIRRLIVRAEGLQ